MSLFRLCLLTIIKQNIECNNRIIKYYVGETRKILLNAVTIIYVGTYARIKVYLKKPYPGYITKNILYMYEELLTHINTKDLSRKLFCLIRLLTERNFGYTTHNFIKSELEDMYSKLP